VACSGAAAALVLFWWSVDRSDPTRLHLQGPGWAGLALGLAALAVSSVACARSGWYHLALALTFLALLAKGLAVVLPAVFCVLDVWPIGRKPSARLLIEKLPFFALSAAFSVLAVWGQASQVGTVVTWEDHGPLERLLQACYGLAYYPSRTLVPLGLSPIHELPGSISISEWRFAASVLAVLALTPVLVLLRRRLPGALAAWIAFAVLISPVLGLFQRGPQLVADRYAYLACLPFALLAGGALAGARRPGRALACASVWIALALPATWRYARAWRSSSALWEHAVRVEPESPMSLMSLAVARAREAAAEPDPALALSLLDESEEHLSRASTLSDDPRILGNLGSIRGQRAELEPERRAELLLESVALAREALAAATEQQVLLPEYQLALGIALASTGQLEQALGHLEQVVGVAPNHVGARLALSGALLALGRPAEATPHLELAVRLAPAGVLAWQRLAEAREAVGRRAAAQRAWQRVLELAPGHARARERLDALRAEAAAGE
jgi:tetratricopeptide (TPR) repeat protein